MAKIYGLFGAMSGKVADVVMSVNRGTQIVRKYQPIVANPQTSAQMEVRAKLKLLSQVGALLTNDALGFKRDGAITVRNQFIRKNFPYVNTTNETQSLALENLQLTGSDVELGSLTVTGYATAINASVNADPTISGHEKTPAMVVFVSISRRTTAEGDRYNLIAVKRVLASNAQNNVFQTTIPLSLAGNYVYAYGVYVDESADAAVSNIYANARVEGEEVNDQVLLNWYRRLTIKNSVFSRTMEKYIAHA